MGILKSVRLGLLHVAVAITTVPITSVLNRVLIEELEILATVVAALTIIPYLLSPIQVWIGAYSDRHPIFGYRRTPYIALGVVMCIGGGVLTPHVGLLMGEDFWTGLLLSLLVFGIWGLGFNLSSVAYLSLASDLSDEGESSRTIAIMWFMMICGLIATGILVSRGLRDYSEEALYRAFNMVGLAAFILALLGLVGLEPHNRRQSVEQRHSQGEAVRAILGNPHARLFFIYLLLLLAALLGQDVLLEPFGGRAFGMTVSETTMLTPIWGGATLIALLLDGLVLNRRFGKRPRAVAGALIAIAGLLLIATSGILAYQPLFIPGVAALGFGTGIATATNLALMLDMTTPAQAGLFIGAWGTANALARGLGNLLGGAGRDLIGQLSGSISAGYISVFLIEALLLAISLLILRQIDISAFRNQDERSFAEIVAVAGDAG